MRTICWNVDTQYDFMRKNGALYVEGAEAIEDNLKLITELAASKGKKVVNTADWHTPSSRELSATPDYKQTFPPHCMQGTIGAEFIPATLPDNPYVVDWGQRSIDYELVCTARNVILYKDDFDIFKGSPHAEEVLKIINPQRAVVYGVATNVCVDFAVQGLRKRGIEVVVPTDAIKELPGLPLEEKLAAWKAAGAILTTTRKVSGYL